MSQFSSGDRFHQENKQAYFTWGYAQQVKVNSLTLQLIEYLLVKDIEIRGDIKILTLVVLRAEYSGRTTCMSVTCCQIISSHDIEYVG